MTEPLTTDDLATALAHLERGDWPSAHVIVQRDEHHPLSCWAHGIVHLLEGDLDNAGYWYRRAGRQLRTGAGDVSADTIAAELSSLRSALGA